MKKRSLGTMLLYTVLSLGIYPIFWYAATKDEMNEKGADLPTAWFLIIPVLNWVWYWYYFIEAEKQTRNRIHALGFTIASFLVPGIMAFITQNEYNQLEDEGGYRYYDRDAEQYEQAGSLTEEQNLF